MSIEDFPHIGDHRVALALNQIINLMQSGHRTLSGPGIDPTGATSSNAAVQRFFDEGGDIFVPPGTYDIDSISITQDVRVACARGVVFRRTAGADQAQGTYWAAGAAMFELNAPGLRVEFSGFTYDGNSANQTTTEPTGFFLKTYPTSSITSAPTVVRISDARFINGTSGYLCLRGDDSRRRYLTQVEVNRCEFTDTVYGKGKGDPSTPTALGYSPNYIVVYDYVHLHTNDLRARFDAATGTAQYAPSAVFGTFYGTDFNTSGRCSIFMHGTTTLHRMGRSAKAYNDDTNWATNNGIGAIDVYGNGEELYVEHVVATDCQNVAIRAKASLTRFTVKAASLINSHRGVQISPSTTGPAVSTVHISNISAQGGTVPVVEVTGTNTGDRIPHAIIENVTVRGTLTNPEALVSEGVIHVRNVRHLHAKGLSIESAPSRAITTIDAETATITGVDIASAGEYGVHNTNGISYALSNFDVRNTLQGGVYSNALTGTYTVRDGRTSGTVNYGIFVNNAAQLAALFENVSVDNVSGSSRGFYSASGDTALVRCRIGAGVTTNFVLHANAKRREHFNEWNAKEYRTTAAPTTGTWVRGDIVWNSAPSAGGVMGWVCTTAGTPGTWSTFGTIGA